MPNHADKVADRAVSKSKSPTITTVHNNNKKQTKKKQSHFILSACAVNYTTDVLLAGSVVPTGFAFILFFFLGLFVYVGPLCGVSGGLAVADAFFFFLLSCFCLLSVKVNKVSTTALKPETL